MGVRFLHNCLELVESLETQTCKDEILETTFGSYVKPPESTHWDQNFIYTKSLHKENPRKIHTDSIDDVWSACLRFLDDNITEAFYSRTYGI